MLARCSRAWAAATQAPCCARHILPACLLVPPSPQESGNPIRIQEATDMCVLYDSLQVRQLHLFCQPAVQAVACRHLLRTN